MRKIDLGCGQNKNPGFIGYDTDKDIPGVDVVCDIEKGLPDKDSTVTEVWCSHFLEHVADPQALINEIWRVCVNGAKVTIKIPLNLENIPGHKQVMKKDWTLTYIDRSKFINVSEVSERVDTHSCDGKPFSYIQSTLTCEVKKDV